MTFQQRCFAATGVRAAMAVGFVRLEFLRLRRQILNGATGRTVFELQAELMHAVALLFPRDPETVLPIFLTFCGGIRPVDSLHCSVLNLTF